MKKIVWRYSFAACAIKDIIKDKREEKIDYYFHNHWLSSVLKKLDFNKLPTDYDSNSYDLIFDSKGNFLKASSELYSNKAA